MSHNVFKIRPPVAVRQCGSMPSQTQRNSGAPPSGYGAASYGHSSLLAPVRHPAVSRQARHVEKSSPAPPVVAHRDASPGSGAEDLGGTGPLDTSLDHRSGACAAGSKRRTGISRCWSRGGSRKRCRPCHQLRTGHSISWETGVCSRSGGRKIRWPKRAGKASISRGFSGFALPC